MSTREFALWMMAAMGIGIVIGGAFVVHCIRYYFRDGAPK